MLPNSTSDSITVPVVSVTTPSGLGVSLLLDPTETMLEVLLNISSSGDVGFERRYQRQTAGNPRLTVTQYIVGHGPDWRPGELFKLCFVHLLTVLDC